MPSCPACGATIDLAAPACPTCGAPATAARAAEPVSAAAPRLVATFNSRSTWSGRQVVYHEQRLSIDGTFLGADKLLDYDQHGWLDWAQEDLLAWVWDLAEWERSSRPQAQATGRPLSESGGFAAKTSTPPGEEDEPPREPSRMEGPVYCPYCAVAVEPPPRASQDCPACGQRMHLQRQAGTDERRLLTEADAAANAEAWEQYHLDAEASGYAQDGL